MTDDICNVLYSLLPVRSKFQLLSLWVLWLGRLHLFGGIFLRVDNLLFIFSATAGCCVGELNLKERACCVTR